MAKADIAPVDETRRTLEKLAQRAGTVIKRLQVAECTAVCVRLALKGQDADEDSEIAVCVQRHVADELSRQIEEIQRIVDALATLPIMTTPSPPE